jgi:hypothetical protein
VKEKMSISLSSLVTEIDPEGILVPPHDVKHKLHGLCRLDIRMIRRDLD